MAYSRRNRMALVAVTLTLAAIGGVVFLATRAEARPGTEATTNDGGAWLVNRQAGFIGHVNREVGELSDSTKVGEPRQPIDVYQPAGTIVVHDRTNNALVLVDERTHVVLNSVMLPQLAEIQKFRDGIVVTAPAPTRIWRVSSARLSELEELATEPTAHEAEGQLLVSVSHNGRLAWVGDDNVVWEKGLGERDAVTAIPSEFSDPSDAAVTDLSWIGDVSVTLRSNDDIVLNVAVTGPELHAGTAGSPSGLQLAQPTLGGSDAVALASENGALVTVDRLSGERTVEIDGTDGVAMRPIRFEGCTWVVNNRPATLTIGCRGDQPERHDLGEPDAELRLRLVNGWVWVNDVTSGSFWLARPGQPPSRIDDWGNVLPQESDGDNDRNQDASGGEGAENQVENADAADAETVRRDDFDEDGINQPPVAADDDAQTPVGRPIRVDVLANDIDPDNDVLLVESFENLTPAGAVVSITPTGDALQVTPEAGYVGQIRITYQINDGRGGTAAASATVVVADRSSSANKAPKALTDVGSVKAGEILLMNVLDNDVDPDGDLLVLDSIEAESGAVQFDPSGHVIFEPDTTSTDGEIELRYVVSDDFGKTAEGLVRVAIRGIAESNLPPDAVNDLLVTTTGQPASLNLLINDTDPDGDALFVAQRPELFSTTGGDVSMTITPDGEFVVTSDEPGTYVFSYAASDGGASDTAQIRVDVSDSAINRSPVAVVDSVVIPVGGTRVVYVLENDGDADGDVVGIVDLDVSKNSGLTVEDFEGVGFKITVQPGAPPRPSFRYSISDGRSEPVTASVVVAVSAPSSVNQPPIARADVAQMRAGRVLSIPVLRNDFDPEGGALRVVAVSQPDGAVASIGPEGQSVRIQTDPTTVTSFNLTYDVADDEGNRTGEVLQVQIVPADQLNEPPVARPDVARTDFDTPVSVSVLINDTDPDGDIIGLESITNQPANGVADIDPLSNEITYVPDPTFSGTDRFTYRIVDSLGGVAQGEVLVGVMPPEQVNLPPEALDDSATVNEGVRDVAIDVLANDFDPDGDQVLLSSVGNAEFGSVRIVDGAVLYTAPTSLSADLTDSFEYAVTDGRGGSASATVTILVTDIPEAEVLAAAAPTPTPVPTPTPTPLPEDLEEDELPNIPPIAVDDFVGPFRPGASVSVDVLANDSDPDGETSDLTVSVSSLGLTVNGDQVELIAPAEPAVFRYSITDARGDVASAQIHVDVLPLVAPVATDDVVGPVLAGEAVVVPVLLNDYDPDGDAVRLVGAAAGTVSGGNISMIAPEVTGQFSYTIADDDDLEATGLFTILVTENRAPTVQRLSVSTDFETPITLNLAPQATDLDGDPLIFVCCRSPRGGSAAVVASGKDVLRVTFTPDKDFSGTAGFSYTVDDQNGHNVAGSVTITVGEGPENKPPRATDASIDVQVNGSASIDLSDLTSDPDEDDTLSWTADSVSYDGLSVSLNGSELSVSADDSTDLGQTSVSYQVTDQDDASASGTVSISVIPPDNQAPVANGEIVQVPAGSAVSVDLSDWTVDNDQFDFLTYSLSALPSAGVSATLAGDIVTVSATINQTGTFTTFSYIAEDRWGETDEGTFNIQVIEPDVPLPSTVDDTATTFQGQAVTIAVLGNDVDPLEGGLSIVSPGLTSAGFTTTTGDLIVFTPDPTFFGSTTFDYTIQDMIQTTTREATGTVAVQVIGRPDTPAPPGAVPDSQKVALTWTSPNGNGDAVDSYQLEHDQLGSFDPGLVNSHTWVGLTNGVTYRFRVRAHNAAGWSEWSEWSVEAKPDIKPQTPDAPTCTHAENQVGVSWTPPVNNGSAVVNYEVRQIGADTRSTTVPNYLWQSLSNGTAYTFRVRAENDAGFSDWSLPSAACVPSTIPGVPSILTTTRGDGNLVVNWEALTAANDGGNTVISYEIESSLHPGTIATVNGANANSYQWGQLQNGLGIEFRVRAVNANGKGTWSLPSQEQVPCGVPFVPTGLQIVAPNPDDGIIWLTWNAAQGNGCEVNEFVLDWGSGSKTFSGDATNGFIDGLVNGQPYSVSAFARNVVGDSGLAAAVGATPAGLPLCPAGFSMQAVANGVQTIDLSWPDILPNGRPLTNYLLRVNGGQWTGLGLTNSFTYVEPTASGGQEFSFQIAASNDVGDSDACAVESAFMCDVPGQPGTATLGADPDNMLMTGSWGTVSVSGANCPAVTHYEVEVGSTPQVSDNLDLSTSATAATWDPLEFDVSYQITVSACNDVGCGLASTLSDSVLIPLPPVTVIAGQGGLDVTNPDKPRRLVHILSVDNLLPNETYRIRCYVDSGPNGSFRVYRDYVWTSDADGFITSHEECRVSEGANIKVRVTGDGLGGSDVDAESAVFVS